MNRIIGWTLVALLFISCGKPLTNFNYKVENPKAPAKVEFQNQSTKAERYEWQFGDGNNSTEPSPVHTFRASGQYTIKLTAFKGEKSKTMEKNIHIKAPEKCLVEIQTDYGNMLVELYDATPQHRDNFQKLSEEGYFDGLLFHRVIRNFMVQGGDPNSRNAASGMVLGSGGPGYTIPAEFNNDLVHLKGTLAAARTGDQVNPEKRSSGSQFYIVQGQPITADQLDMVEARKGIRYSKDQREAYLKLGGTPHLDREYTVFGRVIEGLDVIDKIAGSQTDPRDRPAQDIKMKIIAIK
jgi:peptidyl-prolyl cis-trans isomerase B (cyclophilin B)